MDQRILLVALFALAAACTFDVDPNKGRFICTTANDCGAGYKCVVQKDGSNRSLCFKDEEVTAETCNGLDDDKDGVTDNSPAQVGLSCSTGLKGECATGVYECDATAKKLVCVGPLPVTETCNGKDDDCDGTTDNTFDLAVDPLNCGTCGTVCAPGADCILGHCTEAVCNDGIDNDGNGQTDCADPACDQKACGVGCVCLNAKPVETLCDDHVDNDGNGQTDCADAACDNKPCDVLGRICLTLSCTCPGSEPTKELSCADGHDNDCDGKTDCADSDCAGAACSTTDATKNCSLAGQCVAREALCADTLDNDGDGMTDCADPDCAGLACSTTDTTKNCGLDATSTRACVARETLCADSLDNDGDGKTDCADPDCVGLACNATDNCDLAGACVPRETKCGDGVDNDGDGKTDCDDSDCFGAACDSPDAGGSTMNCGLNGTTRACVAREADCSDGLDNDGDGKTDCADSDCEGKSCGAGCLCVGGVATETSCADGIDNDKDSKTDCDDPDCRGAICDSPDAGSTTRNCGLAGTTPACVAREEICGDGVDNDGDGKTDCADPDCLGAACDSPDAGTTAMNCGVSGATPVCVAREAVCDDNVDNDGDGKTDCADPDCDGKTCAAGKTCKVGVCST